MKIKIWIFHLFQEVRCLQDKYEKLSDQCQDVVRSFTENEDENIELDAILIRACTLMIKKFCEVCYLTFEWQIFLMRLTLNE